MSENKSDQQHLLIGPDRTPKWEDTHKISWKCGIIIFVVVFGSFAGIYYIVSSSSDDGSVLGGGASGGHHFGRGNSLGRGGSSSGGGGGCFDATTTVWAKNETENDKDARKILIKDLEEGDLVTTVALKSFKYKPIGLIWTRATDVDLFWGSWKGHNIIFLGGQNIKVTSPHLMITWKDGQSYIIRADQVQVGDKMKVGNILMSVEKIENYVIKSKVAVETEDGTIRVNDVLASGVCDHNPEAVETIVHTDQMLEKYKQVHFGHEYETMCMDAVAWRDSYLKNNGYSS